MASPPKLAALLHAKAAAAAAEHHPWKGSHCVGGAAAAVHVHVLGGGVQPSARHRRSGSAVHKTAAAVDDGGPGGRGPCCLCIADRL